MAEFPVDAPTLNHRTIDGSYRICFVWEDGYADNV